MANSKKIQEALNKTTDTLMNMSKDDFSELMNSVEVNEISNLLQYSEYFDSFDVDYSSINDILFELFADNLYAFTDNYLSFSNDSEWISVNISGEITDVKNDMDVTIEGLWQIAA